MKLNKSRTFAILSLRLKLVVFLCSMNILIDRISHLPNRKPTFSCDWRISIISGNINAPITAAKITQQLQ